MDLLERRHAQGHRFTPVELMERGSRVAVGLEVTDANRPVHVQIFKVLTFGGPEDVIVQLQDCRDRAEALALLAGDEAP